MAGESHGPATVLRAARAQLVVLQQRGEIVQDGRRPDATRLDVSQ